MGRHMKFLLRDVSCCKYWRHNDEQTCMVSNCLPLYMHSELSKGSSNSWYRAALRSQSSSFCLQSPCWSYRTILNRKLPTPLPQYMTGGFVLSSIQKCHSISFFYPFRGKPLTLQWQLPICFVNKDPVFKPK